MTIWPFGQRGGLTVAPYTSEDPLVCAHQALGLQTLLREFAGRYHETWMVLNRLELVYICAGRRDDADRVYQDKLALVRPASPQEGAGIFGRLRWWWDVEQEEMRYRRGQSAVHHCLAKLHRLAPWDAGQPASPTEDLS
jgi:hypothetical protein